jgi:hypothetical protein
MLIHASRDQAQQAVPIDKDFYRKFWQLQRCLHNPALCGNGTEWIRLTQVQQYVYYTELVAHVNVAVRHGRTRGLWGLQAG